MARSIPAIPSISEWWVLEISAKPSPAPLGLELRWPGWVGFLNLGCEPLDQPHLPQRLGAVELLGEDARREVAQLLPAAGGGQRRVAHVVLEVEARVVHPQRAAAVERRVRVGELLAVAGHEVQPPADLLGELLVRGRRPLQQREPAHVHVRTRPLLVQEGGVHGGEAVEVALGHGCQGTRHRPLQ